MLPGAVGLVQCSGLEAYAGLSLSALQKTNVGKLTGLPKVAK